MTRSVTPSLAPSAASSMLTSEVASSNSVSQGRDRAARAGSVPDRVQGAERSVFLFGFAKNDQDNIDARELRLLRKAAAEMLGWSETQVAAMVANGAWTEVGDEREEVQE